jgi:hypothetical protein
LKIVPVEPIEPQLVPNATFDRRKTFPQVRAARISSGDGDSKQTVMAPAHPID